MKYLVPFLLINIMLSISTYAQTKKDVIIRAYKEEAKIYFDSVAKLHYDEFLSWHSESLKNQTKFESLITDILEENSSQTTKKFIDKVDRTLKSQFNMTDPYFDKVRKRLQL